MANIADAQYTLTNNTAAALASANKVYPEGLFVWENNTGYYKIGDGSTAYNDLKYYTEAESVFHVAGTIRYYGSTIKWDLIDNQSGLHPPINISSITTTSTYIQVNYTKTGSGVVTFIATPDESYAAKGYFIGSSVDVNNAKIYIYKTLNDYITYNGSSWTSFSTKVSLAWNVDHLEITGLGFSSDQVGRENYLTGSSFANATPRNGGYIVNIGSVSATKTDVYFYNYSGTQILTPDTNMKFYIQWNQPVQLNPDNVDDIYGNIWINGVIKI